MWDHLFSVLFATLFCVTIPSLKRRLNKSAGLLDELIKIFTVEEQFSVRGLRWGDVCLHLLTNTTGWYTPGIPSQHQKETAGFSEEEEIFVDGDEAINAES